ncbi:hypothetical protein KA005_81440 [bacterium]|nr:hypothetical protein [bacterium]
MKRKKLVSYGLVNSEDKPSPSPYNAVAGPDKPYKRENARKITKKFV